MYWGPNPYLYLFQLYLRGIIIFFYHFNSNKINNGLSSVAFFASFTTRCLDLNIIGSSKIYTSTKRYLNITAGNNGCSTTLEHRNSLTCKIILQVSDVETNLVYKPSYSIITSFACPEIETSLLLSVIYKVEYLSY